MGRIMRTGTRIALILMAVFTAPGLAGCAAIEELKDSVAAWFGSGNSVAGHAAVSPSDLPDGTNKIPPAKMAGEKARKARKAAKNKADTAASKPQRLQKVAVPNKRSPSVSAETIGPQQGTDAKSDSSQTAPLRLRTPWPEAPVSGSFSR
jgi:hypothetical protein